MPTIPWDTQMKARWDISETAAQDRLDEFVMDELEDYREGRNFPTKPMSRAYPPICTSVRSPPIAPGIAPRMPQH